MDVASDGFNIAVNSVVSRTGTRLAPDGIDIPVNENSICDVPVFLGLLRDDTANVVNVVTLAIEPL